MNAIITDEDRARGRRLAVLRIKRGLSRKDLAVAVGTSEGTVDLIERGGALLMDNTPKRRRRVERFAKVLRVTPRELMHGDRKAT